MFPSLGASYYAACRQCQGLSLASKSAHLCLFDKEGGFRTADLGNIGSLCGQGHLGPRDGEATHCPQVYLSLGNVSKISQRHKTV